MDADKAAAYQTLYHCLVTLSKLLAPFTPFIAEAMYQNLVRSAYQDAPESAAPVSVHLASWPEADSSQVDQRLMDETRLVMRVVSLGRAARSKAGIKVRQPLARVVVKPRSSAEAEGLQRLEPQVLEELNVKALSFAYADADLDRLALASDDAGYAVGLDTRITPELADEGLARELVHRIQNLRKAAGFEISDRITVHYAGWGHLREVLAAHAVYVRQETLADDLLEGPPPPAAHAEEQRVDGQTVTLAVQRL